MLVVGFCCYGNTINLGVNALPEVKVGIFSRSTNHTQILRQIYEPPFLIDKNSKLISPYFKNWFVKNKGKLYEFILNPSLKFSNGEPITINHLKSIIERKDLDGNFLIQHLKKVLITNNKMTVFLEKPNITLPEKLSDLSFAFISEKQRYNFPIGSGAFYINGVNTNDMQLSRNLNHRDFLNGNISIINVKKLDKTVYKLEELHALKIDFFPLVQVTDVDKARFNKFKRILFPSHRTNVLVLNIADAGIRMKFAACLNPKDLFEIPYIKSNSMPYNSVVPNGLENYIPDPNLRSGYSQKKCELFLKNKKSKALRWLNIYIDNRSQEYVAQTVRHIEKQTGFKIQIINKDLKSSHDVISTGEYEIFVCGVGSPYPLAEGILADFIYSKNDKSKLLKFDVPKLRKHFVEYQSSSHETRGKKILELVNILVADSLVIPFARKIDAYLIPDKWRGLTMVNGMNGNFYLGEVSINEN